MYESLNTRLEKRTHFVKISLFLCITIFLVLLSGCSGETYGTKLTFAENNDLYYTENVTAEEAQALGDYLVKEAFFKDGGSGITVQLNKTEGTYEFRMVVIKDAEKDQDTIASMKLFAYEMSQNVFNGENLVAHLCDDTLKTLIVVEPVNYGTKLTFLENNELYYTENVTEEEAQTLGDYLVQEAFFSRDGNLRSIQLDKSGATYEFRMIIKKGLETDPDVIDSMEFLATTLSSDVFDSKAVDVHLCDDNFETLRVVVGN